MMRTFSILAGAACSALLSCNPPPPVDYSILADGMVISSRSGSRLNSVLNVVSDLENPSISGLVTLPGLSVQSNSLTPEKACCTRSWIEADSSVFRNTTGQGSLAWLSLTDAHPVRATGPQRSLGVFRYRVPAITLTPSIPVTLELEVDGRLYSAPG